MPSTSYPPGPNDVITGGAGGAGPIVYVHSTEGSDSTGAGTAENPWATFGHAHNASVADSTIQALDEGPFVEGNIGQGDTHAMHYRGVLGGQTVIDATGETAGVYGYTDRTYADLRVTGATTGVLALAPGRPIGSFLRVTVDACNVGIQAGPNCTNTALDQVRVLDCADMGVNLIGSTGCLFYAVEIARCGAKSVMTVTSGPAHNITAFGNAIAASAIALDLNGADAINVIVDDCGGGSTGVRAATYLNCLVNDSGATPYHASGTILGGCVSNEDPLWADEGAGVYRPEPDSPAWQTGSNTADATTGVDGVDFTDPPHMGAFALADVTAPVVTITSPTGTDIADYTLTGTAADASGIAELEYRVDGGDWTALVAGTAFSVGMVLAQGLTTIDVRATDPHGNAGTASITVGYQPPVSVAQRHISATAQEWYMRLLSTHRTE